MLLPLLPPLPLLQVARAAPASAATLSPAQSGLLETLERVKTFFRRVGRMDGIAGGVVGPQR